MEELLSVLKEIRDSLQSIDEKLDYVRDDVNVVCGVLNDIHGEDKGVTLPEIYGKMTDMADMLGELYEGTSLDVLSGKMTEVVDAIERQL